MGDQRRPLKVEMCFAPVRLDTTMGIGNKLELSYIDSEKKFYKIYEAAGRTRLK